MSNKIEYYIILFKTYDDYYECLKIKCNLKRYN